MEKGPEGSARLLGLIGLGARGGLIIAGVDATRALLQRKECRLVIVASDATTRVEDKVIRLARATKVPIVIGPEASRLGDQLGRPPMMAVGVKDRALAKGILAAQVRSGSDGGVSGQE